MRYTTILPIRLAKLKARNINRTANIPTRMQAQTRLISVFQGELSDLKILMNPKRIVPRYILPK
jgi:hypothetical protein